jgi:hypothetical protein
MQLQPVLEMTMRRRRRRRQQQRRRQEQRRQWREPVAEAGGAPALLECRLLAQLAAMRQLP